MEGEVYRTENPLGLMGYYLVGETEEAAVPAEDADRVVLQRQRDPGDASRDAGPRPTAILGSIFVVGDVDRSSVPGLNLGHAWADTSEGMDAEQEGSFRTRTADDGSLEVWARGWRLESQLYAPIPMGLSRGSSSLRCRSA